MLRRHLQARGITDRRVLAAMARVPRHAFVPDHLAAHAYEDVPLPVGCDQTISQPYMVALMTQEARIDRRSRVLDVGTGSGYHAAVLACIARHVWTIERLRPLAARARRVLHELRVHNVTLLDGDGAEGYAAAAPYQAVLVAAAAPAAPPSLLDQLAVGGRLVIPIGALDQQELVVVERSATGYRERVAGGCRFVPLVSDRAFRGTG